MRNGIILAFLALTVVTSLSSGCLGNSAEANPPLTPASVPEAIELHKAGLNAYVLGNYSEALDLYNQAIAADPGFTRAYIDKGNALMQLKRFTEAIQVYDVVLAREDYLPNVWDNRGKAMMATGNYSAARDSFDRVLQLEPEYIDAKANRDLANEKLQQEGIPGLPETGQV